MRARNFRGRAALLSALGALVAVTLAASLWAGAGATASASAAAPVVVPPTQELALLLGPHEAMSGPDARSTPIQLVNAERPLTGEQTALPVIGHATAAHGAKWLRVMLPGRPNGRTAWIEQAGTVRGHALAYRRRHHGAPRHRLSGRPCCAGLRGDRRQALYADPRRGVLRRGGGPAPPERRRRTVRARR